MKICKECATRWRCALGTISIENGAVSNVTRERRISKGEVLLRHGVQSKVLMVIKVGQVACYRPGIDGKDRPLGLLSHGISFGKLTLLGLSSIFTFVSTDQGRICEVPIDVLKEHLPSRLGYIRLLALEQVRATELVADWAQVMQLQNVQAKVASALLLLTNMQGSHQIKMPTQTVLSHILGIRRETIQRTMKEMSLRSEITHVDRSTYVVDREALVSYVDSD